MNFFKPSAPTPAQLQRLEKIRARGRNHYIFYEGILAWGLPMFLFNAIWDWHRDFGWHIPSNAILHSFWLSLPLRLAFFLVAGYFCGAKIWKSEISEFEDVFSAPTLLNPQK